ncbi:hypothetical protein MW326_003616, partial [Vibrio cholerae]|nr:hypothetical protein [Vibrio cholerae]EJB8380615.1 hypothetical protein [Vibrio cholerae]
MIKINGFSARYWKFSTMIGYKISQYVRLCVFRSFLLKILMILAIFSTSMFPSIVHAAVNVTSFVVVYDGTQPFDSNNEPGNDNDAKNGIVRINDTIEYEFSYVSSQAELVQFVFTLPSGTRWDTRLNNNVICNAGGGFSGVTGNIFTCRRNVTQGAESFKINTQIIVASNNDVLTPTVSINGGTPLNGESVNVSAAPKATTRIMANNLSKTNLNGVAGYSAHINIGIGIDGGATNGVAIVNKGAEPLASGFSFQMSVPNGGIITGGCGSPWSCTQTAPGAPITVTYNSQLIFAGNQVYGFFSPTQVTAVFRPFTVFVPTDPNDTPSDNSDDNFPLGEISRLNVKISDFDPLSISGQSNFGVSYAPSMDPSYSCPVNSGDGYACASLAIDRSVINPLVSSLTSEVTRAGLPNQLIYADNNKINNANTFYSETVLPGQSFSAWSGIHSDQFGDGTISNAGLCFLFDNALLNLTDTAVVRIGQSIVSGGGGASGPQNAIPDSDLVIEYTDIPLADNNARINADCGVAGDGAPNWVSNYQLLSGGIESVTGVRFKYLQPLDISTALGLETPLMRTTTPTSVSLADGSVIPWLWHISYVDDTDGMLKTIRSNYAGGQGAAKLGGRITTQNIMVRSSVAVQNRVGSGSAAAPGTLTSVTVTPYVIGSPITGIDNIANNHSFKIRLETNCLLPEVSSLPSSAVYTPGNFGPDSIPCTSDDQGLGFVTFNIGDSFVPGGAATAGFDGHVTFLSPYTFNLRVMPNTAPGNKTLYVESYADNDLTDLNLFTGQDRTEIDYIATSSIASFTASKATNGVTNGKVGPNEIFGYTVNFANGGSSDSGVGTFIDILPYDGDENGTINLGSRKLEVVALSASMVSPVMGGVTIQYTTQDSASVYSSVSQPGNEDGSLGVSWSVYNQGDPIPAGITAVRF